MEVQSSVEPVNKCSRDLKDDFTDNSKVAREFSNLKTSLRRHLKSEMHNRKIRKVEENDIVKKKEDVRNAVVGVSYDVSKAVNTLVNKQAKVPFLT
jgi:CRISPR/Cas system-associated endonuclease Cas3-HD